MTEDNELVVTIDELREMAKKNTRWRKAVEYMLEDDDVILSSMTPLGASKTTWRQVKQIADNLSEEQNMSEKKLNYKIEFICYGPDSYFCPEKVAAAGGLSFEESDAVFTLCSVIYGTKEDAENEADELAWEADARCGGRGALHYDLHITVTKDSPAERSITKGPFWGGY